jgi:predicted transcriptional regulator
LPTVWHDTPSAKATLRIAVDSSEAGSLTELDGFTQKDAVELLDVTPPAIKSWTLRGHEKDPGRI